MENTVVAIGHNNPPSMAEQVAANLPEHHADEVKQATDILAGVDRMPAAIEDEETAQKATAFIKQIGEVAKNAEATRKATKEPYHTAGKAVDTFFNKTFKDPLARAKLKVQCKLHPYIEAKAKAERIAQEEARAKAEEEAKKARAKAEEEAKQNATSFAAEEASLVAAELDEAAEKAAKTAENHKTAVRSDMGATTSTRTTWVGEITDLRAIDLDALRDHFTVGDIEKALRGFIRAGGRTIKGADIREKSTVVVR